MGTGDPDRDVCGLAGFPHHPRLCLIEHLNNDVDESGRYAISVVWDGHTAPAAGFNLQQRDPSHHQAVRGNGASKRAKTIEVEHIRFPPAHRPLSLLHRRARNHLEPARRRPGEKNRQIVGGQALGEHPRECAQRSRGVEVDDPYLDDLSSRLRDENRHQGDRQQEDHHDHTHRKARKGHGATVLRSRGGFLPGTATGPVERVV